MSFLMFLQIILIPFKLAGLIDLSWPIVLTPMFMDFGFTLIVLAIKRWR